MMSRGTRVSSSRRALRVSARVGLGELFEEGVRFAVDDAVALLDCGAADGLGDVALARTGRAEKQSVFALGDEAGGGELEDECAVDLPVEGEVEAVEGAVGVAESGLLVSPGEEAVLTTLELVGDEGCPTRRPTHFASIRDAEHRIDRCR